MTTLNRLEVCIADKKWKVVKKSHFDLNAWNKVSVSISKATFALLVNGTVRVKLTLESDGTHSCSALFGSIKSILSSKFTFGGTEGFNAKVKQFIIGIDKDYQHTSALFDKKGPCISSPSTDELVFITSLYELARFNPKHFHMHSSRTPWHPRTTPRQRKVVMCHDLPAGILEDKYTQGLYPFGRRKELRIEDTQYRFLNW